MKVAVPQSLDPILLTRPDGTTQAYAVKGGKVDVDDRDVDVIQALVATLPEGAPPDPVKATSAA